MKLSSRKQIGMFYLFVLAISTLTLTVLEHQKKEVPGQSIESGKEVREKTAEKNHFFKSSSTVGNQQELEPNLLSRQDPNTFESIANSSATEVLSGSPIGSHYTPNKSKIFRNENKPISVLFPTPERKWIFSHGQSRLGIVTFFDQTCEIAFFDDLRSTSTFSLSEFSEDDRLFLINASRGLLKGRIVGVFDGDSCTLLVCENTEFKIRLAAIDAPEKGQEFAKKAKEELSAQIYNKEVTIEVCEQDKFQRFLGYVFIDDRNINAEMVAKGLAWNFDEYSNDDKLAEAQLAAISQKLGLWSGYMPMAPWDFRSLKNELSAKRRTSETLANAKVKGGDDTTKIFWINLSTSTRHNQSCRWFEKTKSGRLCDGNEGNSCGVCGG